jgi:hypothetical protein
LIGFGAIKFPVIKSIGAGGGTGLKLAGGGTVGIRGENNCNFVEDGLLIG